MILFRTKRGVNLVNVFTGNNLYIKYMFHDYFHKTIFVSQMEMK